MLLLPRVWTTFEKSDVINEAIFDSQTITSYEKLHPMFQLLAGSLHPCHLGIQFWLLSNIRNVHVMSISLHLLYVSCLLHMIVHLPASRPQIAQLAQEDNGHSCDWQDCDNYVRKETNSDQLHWHQRPLSWVMQGPLLLWRFASCLFTAIRCWHTS